MLQVQDFALVLLEFHKVPVDHFHQPAMVTLDVSPALRYISWTQCSVVCSRDESACLISSRSLIKMMYVMGIDPRIDIPG